MKKGTRVYVYGSGNIPSQYATYLGEKQVRGEKGYRVCLEKSKKEDLVSPSLVFPVDRTGNPFMADRGEFTVRPDHLVDASKNKSTLMAEMTGHHVEYNRNKETDKKPHGYIIKIDGEWVGLGNNAAQAQSILLATMQKASGGVQQVVIETPSGEIAVGEVTAVETAKKRRGKSPKVTVVTSEGELKTGEAIAEVPVESVIRGRGRPKGSTKQPVVVAVQEAEILRQQQEAETLRLQQQADELRRQQQSDELRQQQELERRRIEAEAEAAKVKNQQIGELRQQERRCQQDMNIAMNNIKNAYDEKTINSYVFLFTNAVQTLSNQKDEFVKLGENSKFFVTQQIVDDFDRKVEKQLNKIAEAKAKAEIPVVAAPVSSEADDLKALAAILAAELDKE